MRDGLLPTTYHIQKAHPVTETLQPGSFRSIVLLSWVRGESGSWGLPAAATPSLSSHLFHAPLPATSSSLPFALPLYSLPALFKVVNINMHICHLY